MLSIFELKNIWFIYPIKNKVYTFFFLFFFIYYYFPGKEHAPPLMMNDRCLIVWIIKWRLSAVIVVKICIKNKGKILLLIYWTEILHHCYITDETLDGAVVIIHITVLVRNSPFTAFLLLYLSTPIQMRIRSYVL